PFFVIQQSQPWSPPSGIRRAGISSFGIGGTNAHLIVEQAPPPPPTSPPRLPPLLLLSARSPHTLTAAAAALAAHLRRHPDLPLSDVAYTLQVGRRRLPHPLAVVCTDLPPAPAALAGDLPHKPRR